MSIVKRMALTTSAIALLSGSAGVITANAATLTSGNPQTTLTKNADQSELWPISNFSPFEPEFEYFGIDGVSANNTFGEKYTAESTILSLRADSRVLEDVNASGAVFVAQDGTSYEAATFVNGKIIFNIPVGEMNGGVVYIEVDNDNTEMMILALDPLS